MAIPKLQAYVLPESHDIPKNKVDWAQVLPWSAVLPQPVTYPYHPPQNDKGFNNDYHLYFRSLT